MHCQSERNYSDEAEVARLRKTGEEIFGLTFDTTIVPSGCIGNTLGIQSEALLFSRRLDSRTYFVQDSRFGVGREADVFCGPDHELLAVCHSLLKWLGIPPTEIGQEVVVQEHTQVASIDSVSSKATLEPVEKGNRFGQISRRIEGHPVWNSSCLVGLTKERQIGFCRLHWPVLPEYVVEKSHALAYRLRGGDWRPPECPEAAVESCEAGITHSLAVGFVMDIYPAIRVVYAPLEKGVGRKPVRYFDRHGKDVPTPRNHAWNLDEILPRGVQRVIDTCG